VLLVARDFDQTLTLLEEQDYQIKINLMVKPSHQIMILLMVEIEVMDYDQFLDFLIEASD
jgi:hypothetical protein